MILYSVLKGVEILGSTPFSTFIRKIWFNIGEWI